MENKHTLLVMGFKKPFQMPHNFWQAISIVSLLFRWPSPETDHPRSPTLFLFIFHHPSTISSLWCFTLRIGLDQQHGLSLLNLQLNDISPPPSRSINEANLFSESLLCNFSVVLCTGAVKVKRDIKFVGTQYLLLLWKVILHLQLTNM